MEGLKRPYKLDIGTAQCTHCGASIRKYYIALNGHKPICSRCVNGVFNLGVTKEELSVPIRLIELADKYVLNRLYLQQYQNVPIQHGFDLRSGITQPKYIPKGLGLEESEGRFYLGGKLLKKGWLDAIQHHLNQKYHEIVEDEQKTRRSYLVCGNCKKPLYYKGVVASKGGSYNVYHCLAGKGCANSNSKVTFAHYGGNDIRVVGKLIK